MDGDTRGGAALSIHNVTGAPIKLVGVGEKLSALEPFYPERLASRILGMGDALTLIEKTQSLYSEDQAKTTRGEAAQGQLYARRFSRADASGAQARLDRRLAEDGAGTCRRRLPKNFEIPEREFVKVEAIISLDDARRAAQPEPAQRIAPQANRARFGHARFPT